MFRKFILSNLALFLILIFAAILRLAYLGEVPPGPAFDEIQVIINSISLAKTGQPIPGTVDGIFGQARGNYQSGIFSELASYSLVPWMYIFGFSWPAIKIPFILASLGMIIFVYLITKKLINKNCGLIAALLFSINPWSVYVGRTAYEPLLSYVFYLIALFEFINLTGWKLLIPLLFSFLGFLSYFAAKSQLLPLVFFGVLFNQIYHPKKNIRPIILVIILTLTFFVGYMIIFLSHPASYRLGETASQVNYAALVDQKRRISLPSPLAFLAINKLSESFRERLISALGGLNPIFLFVEGPSGGAETLIISDHGPMYLIDALFVILGLIFLARRYPKALFYLLTLIFIALIPNAVRLSLNQYIFRDGLLFPVLTIMAAGGLYYLTTLNLPRKIRMGIFSLVFIANFISFLIFINQYFFRTPIDKNEGWNLQNRVLSHYLVLSAQNTPRQQFTIVVRDINGVSSIYLLFSKNYQNKQQILNLNSNLAKFNYKFNQVEFMTDCPKNKLPTDSTLIVDYRINCQAGNSQSLIASPKDSGGKYYIYHDQLCGGGKTRYPKVNNFNDLDIETMTKEEFCNKWITNP